MSATNRAHPVGLILFDASLVRFLNSGAGVRMDNALQSEENCLLGHRSMVLNHCINKQSKNGKWIGLDTDQIKKLSI